MPADSCPICLCDLGGDPGDGTVLSLACGHTLHAACLRRCLSFDAGRVAVTRCPSCRAPVDWDRVKRAADVPRAALSTGYANYAMRSAAPPPCPDERARFGQAPRWRGGPAAPTAQPAQDGRNDDWHALIAAAQPSGDFRAGFGASAAQPAQDWRNGLRDRPAAPAAQAQRGWRDGWRAAGADASDIMTHADILAMMGEEEQGGPASAGAVPSAPPLAPAVAALPPRPVPAAAVAALHEEGPEGMSRAADRFRAFFANAALAHSQPAAGAAPAPAPVHPAHATPPPHLSASLAVRPPAPAPLLPQQRQPLQLPPGQTIDAEALMALLRIGPPAGAAAQPQPAPAAPPGVAQQLAAMQANNQLLAQLLAQQHQHQRMAAGQPGQQPGAPQQGVGYVPPGVTLNPALLAAYGPPGYRFAPPAAQPPGNLLGRRQLADYVAVQMAQAASASASASASATGTAAASGDADGGASASPAAAAGPSSWCFVLDVSGSMGSYDSWGSGSPVLGGGGLGGGPFGGGGGVSRVCLALANLACAVEAQAAPGDWVQVLAYGHGEAELRPWFQRPVTFDRHAFLAELAAAAACSGVQRGGTYTCAALRRALTGLAERARGAPEGALHTLILLTDGQAHDCADAAAFGAAHSLLKEPPFEGGGFKALLIHIDAAAKCLVPLTRGGDGQPLPYIQTTTVPMPSQLRLHPTAQVAALPAHLAAAVQRDRSAVASMSHAISSFSSSRISSMPLSSRGP